MKAKMKKYQKGGASSKFGIKSYNFMDTEKGGPANSSSKQLEGVKYGEGNKRKYIDLDVNKGTMTKTKFDKNNEAVTKVKNIGAKRVANKISKITSQKTGGATKMQSGGTSGGYPESGGKMMKTGGMVNPNAKIQAAKSAGSKGVKSGVNPKAAASKVAKGRSGGTSAAPKTAMPKAKYGMTLSKKQKGGPSDAADAMIAQQLKSRAVQKGMNQARVAARKGKAGKI